MSERPEPTRVEITDPRSLRALAHPIRLRLLGLLRARGPLTATAAGELLGESAGSASFHLRQLAKHGLVEEAGRNGRSRPWRATAQLTAVPSVAADPELAAASDVFRRLVAQGYAELMRGWLDRKPGERAEWQEAGGGGDRYAYMTAAEVTELHRGWERLVAPFEARMREGAARPAEARLVTVVHLAIPAEEPPARR